MAPETIAHAHRHFLIDNIHGLDFTVAGLAERIQEQGLNIEELLSEVESLSDEDIEVLLSTKTENNEA